MTYRHVVVEDGPTGYWRLGEVSGTTAADEMGNHPGTYVGSPTLGVAGPLVGDTNKAVYFDGVDDYVNATTLGSFGSDLYNGATVEAWVKTTETTIRRIGAVYNLNSTTALDLLVNDGDELGTNVPGAVKGYIRNEAGVFKHFWTPNIGINDGAWHHIVAVFNPSTDTYAIYKDGVAQTVTTYVGANGNPANNFVNFAYPWTWGAANSRGTIVGFLPGSLDEPAIYSHVLTPDRIARHYHHGLGKKGFDLEMLSSRPTAWWKLEETTGTTAADQTTAYPGTFAGTPTLGATGIPVGGASVTFDGVDDEASTALWLSTSAFTLEAWVKTNTVNQDQYRHILSGDSRGYIGWNATTDPELGAYVNSAWTGATFGPLTAGQWHHLVGTFDGANLRAYKDGVLITTTAAAGSTSGGYQLRIASHGWTGAPGRFYAGSIDEAATYDRALPAWEIRRHYQRGIGVFNAKHDIVLRDGAALWLDAAEPAVGAVATRKDLTGNARNATQGTAASQPSKVDSVFGTQPAVRFDGVDDRVATAAFASEAQPNTIILVFSWANKGGHAFVYDGISGTARHSIYHLNGGSIYGYAYDTAFALFAPTLPLAVNTWTAIFDGASSVVRYGSTVYTGSVGASGITGLNVGSSWDGFSNFQGDIAEVMFFDRRLLAHELKQIETDYLAKRYGIGTTQVPVEDIESGSTEPAPTVTEPVIQGVWGVFGYGEVAWGELDHSNPVHISTAIPGLLVWNGTSFTKKVVKVWTGTEFAEPRAVYIYDGTTWVEV